MLTFMMENLATILISLALVLIIAAIIVSKVINKQKGNCSCSCVGCSLSGTCRKKK